MKQRHITSLAEGMLSGDRGPDEAHQLRDPRTSLRIPSDLVTMERFDEETDEAIDEATDDEITCEYNLMFATPRIAQIVADVQEKQRRTNNR